MISIYLNSKEIVLEEKVTLKQILDASGFCCGHIAIALNRQFVPREDYLKIELKHGDQIDVVTPMQGG